MKILYHHRTQGRGAEGTHIMSIVNELEALGHEVTILSPPGVDPRNDAGKPPVDKSEVETRGVNSLWKLISKHLPNVLFEFVEIGYNLHSMPALEKALRGGDFDLVYERYSFYTVSGALKARKHGIPLVLEANEVSGIPNRARRQSMPRLCAAFERFLFRRCAAIHTVSSYLKNMIVAQGVDSARVRVVPNAINPDKFGGEVDAGELRARYGLEDCVVAGFAGWFDDWDRLDLLVEVFARLAERHPRLKLLLVGDGEVLTPLRARADALGVSERIVLTGAVKREQIQQYLSMLDIAVITHSNDFGSPVVMFEFMGLKIPIVAPRLLPITDVLGDGEQALLFDVLDMKGMEDRLESLVADPALRARLAENAYRLLMEKHTWRQNAELIVADAAGG